LAATLLAPWCLQNARGLQQDSDPKSQTPSGDQQGSSAATHSQAGQNPSTTEQTGSGASPTASQSSQKNRTAKKKRTRHKRAPSQSGKTVVRNGGARDKNVELAPAMTKEQEAHNRENTNQLLATTDTNLKSVEGRQLTQSQQSLRDQIHAYMRQAKTASDAGDLTRAQTLAYKARLLSDELAKK
jgi:hypothetical protein